ncbi:MAG: FtsX-like permease family protein, partial [Ruminococcus sp.]|nr:FtsX-like permease family protein [Ruminococcus sp.]
GLEISVVGIIRPNEDAAATSISGGIAYKPELMTYLLGLVKDSEIIKEQLDKPDIDVLTGLKFKTEETQEDQADQEVTQQEDTDKQEDIDKQEESDAAETEKQPQIPEGMSEEEFAAMMAQYQGAEGGEMELPEGLSQEQLEAMMAEGGVSDPSELTDMGMGAMSGMDMQAMMSGDGSFMDSLTDTQREYISSLTDEQMELMQKMIAESSQSNTEALANSGKYSSSSYEQNLQTLGYATIEKPNSINIYPKDFASKEKIIEEIDKYNKNAEEGDEIEYTDVVGLMMSSVTNIIDAISYVLIAFVAISLVVSSIMIGIITYISVLERTKEIGILRSIGASKKDISRVFNAETAIVGFVAGLLGIGISYLLTIPINAIIAHLTDVPMRASIPVVAAVILIAISVVLTMIAGLFPAKVAAKKDPVIALRTE